MIVTGILIARYGLAAQVSAENKLEQVEAAQALWGMAQPVVEQVKAQVT